MFRTILFIFITNLFYNAEAQSTKDFYYNEKSATLYEKSQWKELIKLSKEEIKKGNDFYNLRIRTGIAYYELKKYRLAIPHFKKALQFDKNEAVTLEYLYYSYLFSGQESEALYLYKQNENALVKVKCKTAQLIKSIYTEGGVKLYDPETKGIDPMKFFHIGISHQISPSLNIYQGYSHLSQNISFYKEEYNGGNGAPKNWILTNDTYYQNEYFIRASIRISEGLMFLPAYHNQDIKNNESNYALFAGVTKNGRLIQLHGAFSYSRINKFFQQQSTIGIIIYPLGNLNLYLQTDYTLHNQMGSQSDIFNHKLGSKITKSTWLELTYEWGGMKNFVDMDAFYIQNVNDIIETKIGTTLIQKIKNKHSLLFGYVLENKKAINTSASYKYHTLFAGIILKF